MTRLPLLASLLAAPIATLPAQAVPRPIVDVGTRVRVRTLAGPLGEHATVVAAFGDTLVIRHQRASVASGSAILVDTVPLRFIDRLEVMRGRDWHEPAAWSGAGAVIGTIAGWLIGTAFINQGQSHGYTHDVVVRWSMGLGALTGAATGFAVGWQRGVQWEPVIVRRE